MLHVIWFYHISIFLTSLALFTFKDLEYISEVLWKLGSTLQKKLMRQKRRNLFLQGHEKRKPLYALSFPGGLIPTKPVCLTVLLKSNSRACIFNMLSILISPLNHKQFLLGFAFGRRLQCISCLQAFPGFARQNVSHFNSSKKVIPGLRYMCIA